MKKTLVVAVIAIAVTFANITATFADVKIYGKGHGHGVGMSMAGTYGMAKAGYNYRKIAAYYYPGAVLNTRDDNKVINAYCPKHKRWVKLKVRDYLNRLAEEPDTWPREALRSLMVAARTYLWYKLERHGNMPSGQYWIHTINPATRPNIVAAVKDTTNRVMTVNNRAIVAAYSASAGGYTAKMSEVWGGSDKSYLRNRESPWDSVFSSSFNWRKTLTNAQLQKAYPAIGSFRSLAITARTSSDHIRSRAKTVKISGSKGSVTDKGWNFRGKMGLKSNYFFLSDPGNIRADIYKPQTFARNSRARRLSRRKARRFFSLYKAYKSKYRRERKRSRKRRYLTLAKRYYRYYRLARKGLAVVDLRWKVLDAPANSKAYVKLRVQHKTYSRSAKRKKDRSWRLYRINKVKYKRTRNRTLKRRYLQMAKIYYRRYRKIKPSYRNVKTINYGYTPINKIRIYKFKTSKAGAYRYFVYAKDRAGNMQKKAAKGSVRVL